MKKNRLLCLLIMSLMLLSLLPGTAAATSFADTKGHWAQDYIDQLTAKEYLHGYPDGTFKPDKFMSRAEFTKSLITCMNISANDTSTRSFMDTGNHWAKAYINEAVKRGILIPDEYPNGLEPDGAIKRSESSAMLVRALGKKSDDVSALPFTDSNSVETSMYRGHIKVAYDIGLISGFPNGDFEPFSNMTRAQVCTVLCKFINIYDGTGTTTPIPPGDTVTSGKVNYVAIGEDVLNIYDTSVYFKVDFTNIRVSSIAVSSDFITVNSRYRFFLDSSLNNPDIVVYNNRYGVSKLTIKGDKLVAYPSYRKVDSFSYGNYKYQSDFVNLYINSANSDYYLSDLEIIDEYTVKIDGEKYNLSTDKITIELSNEFYDIQKINLSNGETTFRLAETDAVIKDGISLSDISAIFAGDSTLNLDKIDSIDFMIDSERYSMNKVIIDASGNFTVGRKTYPPEKVEMIIDHVRYTIDHIRVYKDKFIFYCTEDDVDYWVMLNDDYVDSAKLQILKDSIAYEIDKVLVVDKNVVRIKGKQYDIDSTFKCRYDDKIYDIDLIKYDSRKDIIIIEGDKSKDSYWTSQPVKFVFFVDDRKYQDGANDDVNIKAGKKWVYFEQILVSNPSTFTYDG
ncbi:MAG: S-layer homology domain-containing protein, partial [Syntrophomonadaceae bacterium]|nr:S-layer homology domain-containing protein [Syntrophomonadaceae bacterium]